MLYPRQKEKITVEVHTMDKEGFSGFLKAAAGAAGVDVLASRLREAIQGATGGPENEAIAEKAEEELPSRTIGLLF